MAARRFLKSSIDWAAFAERVPANQKPKFHQFKAKVDRYTKNLMSFPEKPPAIDFAAYRSRLPNQAMVNEFEKQYNSLTISYPADKVTPMVDEQEKQVDIELNEIRELSELACQYYERQIKWWYDMMPFDQMTMDDFFDYFPNSKQNPTHYPNFWPHEEPFRPVFPYLEKKDH